MTNITKITNVIKRKVNESRVRNTVSSILDDALPNILAELDVRKTHGDKRIENPATGNAIKLRTALKAKKGSAVYAKGKAMYNAFKDKPANESVKGKLERLKELLDTNVNERAYASTDGKPTFDYDPGEGKLTEVKIGDMVKIDKAYGGGKGKVKDKKGSFVVVNGSSYHESDVKVVNESVSKLTEAEDYKYKKQVAKAFDKINDEMFKFRHSMGLKQLTNKDRKLKDKVESLQMAIFDLQKEMKKDGLTEGKVNEALNAPKKFTVKKKIRVDGNIYNPGTYILKKKKAGGGIYLNTSNNEMLGAYTGTLQAANSGFFLEGKLTEAKLRKGDLVGVDDEIGVVNKVKGRVAYIKLPSMPGSFHPIEVERAKYKGKFKGKDLYISEGKLTEGTKVKIGDVLYLGKRKGKVTKVMSDMANVDFGNGDVYGITFARIKGNKIDEGK